MMTDKRGTTLMEIMIVLIILGVVASIGVPAFIRMTEESRSNEARVNLGVIHMAQKIYKANNSTYWHGGDTTIAAINTALNTDITSRYYDTGINVTGAVNTYSAALARTAGAPTNWSFTSSQTGAINCTGTGCPCSITTNTPLGCA